MLIIMIIEHKSNPTNAYHQVYDSLCKINTPVKNIVQVK